MTNILDTLSERGYIHQVSDANGLRRALEQPLSLYCGYDPTAPSYHIGNLLSIMILAHFQRAGHRPIAVVGGGTGMVGDPSGKTAQRPILTIEEIEQNLQGLRSQLERYMDFSDGRALIVNNADWLLPLSYISFLRDIGRHFSVNQMLAAEAYKTRLEAGLSFLEFNYMLLQAYDFLQLFRTHRCVLQIGGSDQWANCLAGADLIRRTEGAEAFVLVAPLLTTASGEKMGKTERGAVWLDADLTPPYDFYQYWVNVDDRDVERLLALYTFLPIDEVRRLGGLQGADLRFAKEVLAYETTALTHGVPAAEHAREASHALFSGSAESAEAAPTSRKNLEEFRQGLPLIALLVETGLASSRGAARTLIEQGGAYVNGDQIRSVDATITPEALQNGAVLLRAGKKRYHRILVD
ncbi:MAG TPA: tyrosine--tRNA ligase [Dehalococcoidia bacterium]|nr:tyrosine--tRNA ligase [Dehalococcoidia bacterium]